MEPTDWFGGQMTNQGVSAIDFGGYNVKSINQPKSFQSLIQSIAPNYNPGNCWVSAKCYQPQLLIEQWILPTLKNLSKYLTVYDRTVIKDTLTVNSTIQSISAIKRQPINVSQEWTYLLSEQLEDWYSPNNSKLFTKEEYTFNGKVFIEATEFGDLMMNSGIQISQGVETPNENSKTSLDQCGQASTITFFMKLLSEIPANPPNIPSGNTEGEPYSYQNFDWLQVWTYRRAYDSIPNSPQQQINYNDIMQQNWGGGNDFDSGYIFLSILDAQKQVNQGNWRGGINISALAQEEQRAFGWYHYYINTSNQSNVTTPFDPKQLIMYFNCSNTSTGLSKIPYLRDVRRPYGLFGFRLNHASMTAIYNETSKSGHYSTGYKFEDRIAIGNYNFDMHLLNNECHEEYPNYIYETNIAAPYYIPFRSIANQEINNLLFAGKNIAQSFYANAATRLHPLVSQYLCS